MSERLVCTIAPIEAILRLASRYPVFPCRRYPEEIPGRGLMKAKSPLVESGFHAATQDQEQIRAWWSHWPDALVGVPTGAQTGLLVVDYDVDKVDEAANDWVSEHIDELSSTRSHTTLSGGRHYLFRKPADVQYRTGSNLTLGGEKRKGIDLRADGGYIIWWPMHGGSAAGDIAPLPVGLIDEQRVQPVHELPPLPEATPESWARDRDRVAKALGYLDPTDYDEWIRTGMAVHLGSGGSDDGFNLWHAWSAGELTGDTPTNYTGISDCRYHWSTFGTGRGRPVTLGSVFEAAKAQGYAPDRNIPESPPLDAYADEEALAERAAIQEEASRALQASRNEEAPEKPERRPPLDWSKLSGLTPPGREWAIHYWLGMGHVTLMAGGPGTGKTTVAQAMGSCLAVGRDYLDETMSARRVLMWAAEDDENELWRRQIAIAQWLGVPLEQFSENLFVHSYDGKECELAGLIDQRRLVRAPMYDELCAQIGDYKAEVVILDNVARLYAGSENDRHQVTSFVAMLTGAARPTNAAVMLLAHPGKALGSEYSGSTAWEGSVRSRLYLGRKLPDMPVDDDEALDDEEVRYLCRRKANYGPRDWRRLTYEEGVMVPDERQSAFKRAGPEYAREIVSRAVRKLADMNEFGNTSTNSPRYLPKLAKQYGLLEDITDKQFAGAMREMRKDGILIVDTVGQYANRAPREGLKLAENT